MSQTQETLEEAAESYVKQKWEYSQEGNKESFIAGAEWKARRMYSEEEVLKILEYHDSYKETFIYQYIDKEDMKAPEKWFEQFKKPRNTTAIPTKITNFDIF
jgi:hypothetical protein